MDITDQMWSWTRIREALINPPVLSFVRFDLPTYIECDASYHSVGCVVFQEAPSPSGKLQRQVVAYLSKSFTKPQRKWSMYKKELYAAYFSVKKCTDLLGMCQSVIIRTDCKAVSGLLTQKPNPMIARWLTMFLDLDVKWEFIKGSENTFADLLSRHVFTSDDGGPLPPAPDEPPAPAISSKTFGEIGRRITSTSDTEQAGDDLVNDDPESDEFTLSCTALEESPVTPPSSPAPQGADELSNVDQHMDNLSAESTGIANGEDA
jgi:hypothetical protein